MATTAEPVVASPRTTALDRRRWLRSGGVTLELTPDGQRFCSLVDSLAGGVALFSLATAVDPFAFLPVGFLAATFRVAGFFTAGRSWLP